MEYQGRMITFAPRPFLLAGVLAASLVSAGGAVEASDMMEYQGRMITFAPELDESKSVKENVEKGFEQFAHENAVAKGLTGEELELYKERVLQEGIDMASSDHLEALPAAQKAGKFKEEMQRAVSDEEPAVTEKDVAAVNMQKPGWEASKSPEMANMSMRDFQMLLGAVVNG